MDAVAAWILLPLVLLLASWGTGLLVERLLGTELEGGLAVPLGFGATMVVLSVPYGLGLPATVATAEAAVEWIRRDLRTRTAA